MEVGVLCAGGDAEYGWGCCVRLGVLCAGGGTV